MPQFDLEFTATLKFSFPQPFPVFAFSLHLTQPNENARFSCTMNNNRLAGDMLSK